MTQSTVQLLIQQHGRKAFKPCISAQDHDGHLMHCAGDLVGNSAAHSRVKATDPAAQPHKQATSALYSGIQQANLVSSPT
jgi:hypothetical protein